MVLHLLKKMNNRRTVSFTTSKKSLSENVDVQADENVSVNSLGSSISLKKVWQFHKAIIEEQNYNNIKLRDLITSLAFFFARGNVFIVSKKNKLKKISFNCFLRSAFNLILATFYCEVYIWKALWFVLNFKPNHKVEKTEMEFLYVKNSLSPNPVAGGAQAHTLGVVEEFKKRKILSGIIVNEKGALEATKKLHICKMKFVPSLSRLATSCRFSFDAAKHLCAIVKTKNKKSLIYQRYALNDLSALFVKSKLQIPIVLEYNGSEVWASAKWGRPLRWPWLSWKIEQLNLENADCIVTVSKALYDEILQRGIVAKKVLWYPNCVNIKTYNGNISGKTKTSIRRAIKIKNTSVTGCFVGTFGRWHGAIKLARCLKTLFSEYGKSVGQFVFIGDGLQKPAVEKVLTNEINSNQVRLTGLIPQRQTPKIMAACDYFVAPHDPNPDGTLFFGSPTKLFEYMAMGKPVIASELDQLAEIVKPALRPNKLDGAIRGEVGILVNPLNEQELLAALRWMNNPLNKHKMTRMGINGRKLITKRFLWNHHVDKILQRIKTLGLISR